ncbi:MAG: glycerate kinase [Firmicutes bacterium HGW-Firmicutes-19]|jgi:glycerate 2-kinase|nr:MAG: glycerate kinase [Firmicutes bacterium HGW-Firmicutes-19]
MKKIICIPDSFKGTLSSAAVCDIMEKSIHHHFEQCNVVKIEVADGGEGSVDAFLAAVGGRKVTVSVNNPYFEPMESFYGILDGNVAVVEMAAAAGLPLVNDRPNPMETTTYGVGELIVAALKQGCKKIIVGLGGSSTNDGGCGAACAIGVRFYDAFGESFVPTGKSLIDIARIDISGVDSLLDGVEIITMCDIDNPMYGLKGAAHIFSPQKGADNEMVLKLDEGLQHLSNIIKEQLKLDVSTIPGGGAAGAMGAGMVAFFNSRLQMGIETILDLVEFDHLIEDADLIFTGEGKIDSQSLQGKVPIGVAKRAKKAGVDVIAVVGTIGSDIDAAYQLGITAIFSINPEPVPFEVAKLKSEGNLTLTMDNILRLLKRKS